jgi:hypothetical protein
MAQFDMKKLSLGDKVVAGAGVVTLISLFLPWLGYSVGSFSASESGWGTGFIGWFGAVLIVVAAVYLVMMRSGANLPDISWGPGVVVFGASLVGTLLVLLRWLTLPHASYAGGYYSWGPRIGIYLTLVAGIFQVIYALRFFRSTGERAPWVK